MQKGVVQTAIFRSVEVALVGKAVRQWDLQPGPEIQENRSPSGKRAGALLRLRTARLESRVEKNRVAVQSNKRWPIAKPSPRVKPARLISLITINALRLLGVMQGVFGPGLLMRKMQKRLHCVPANIKLPTAISIILDAVTPNVRSDVFAQ